MNVRHAAVFLDHQEARVFHLHADETVDEKVLHPHKHVHRHPKGAAEGKSHPADGERFFHEVATSLADAEEILVVGPGKAKLEFIKHVHKHDHALEPKIVGVETVDHPTDGQLVAYARTYFKRIDKMV